MNAGLPGIGLSGVFYVVSALLMPFVELGRAISRRPRRRSWRLVMGHWCIAVVMICAMWAAGGSVTFVVRAAGRHLNHGSIWASLGFALVPFLIVYATVAVVTIFRREIAQDRA